MPTIRSTSDVLQVAQSADLTLVKHLRPLIFGPKAALHRFSKSAEKAGILVDYYQAGVESEYDWPGKISGSIVDLDYVKVWVENALLNYFNDYIGTGQTVAPVASYTNRVRSSGLVFKTANSVSRTATLYDRDVTVGDVVYLRGVVAAVPYEHWTTVSDFVAETVAAVTAAATADAANKSTQLADCAVEQVDGTPINDITADGSAAAYDSRDDGYINRVYTVTVTQGSVGNDATTALLRVRSADGLDDQDDVSPAAFGDPTAIGTKGATVTFDIDAAQSSDTLLDQDDFIVGQQWTVTVAQAFTKPVATSGGTYTGPSSSRYIIRVTRGGLYAADEPPQITVSTTTGVDTSGPTDITGTGAFSIGNYGVTAAFSTTGLRKGDIYYATVTAAAPGAVRTLVLKNDMPTEMLAATDLDLRLFIKLSSVEVTANRSQPDVGANWTADQDAITLEGDLQLTTDGLTNGGVARYVTVESAEDPGYGKLYVEYREWDIALAGTIYDIASRDDVASVLGTVDPDNPVAFAVDLALQNTAGEVLTQPSAAAADNADVIRCTVLGGDPDDSDNWSDVLSLLAGEDDVYNLVPLTTDSAVHDLVKVHVLEQSTSAKVGYRAALFPAVVTSPSPLVRAATSEDGEVVLATIADNAAASGTQYTYLSVPAGNANFITNGVRAGDIVRFEYTLDAFGEETWTEYEVASVLSESSLLLVAGPDAAVSVAQRVEVWRSLTGDEVVEQVSDRAAALKDWRIVSVWPDTAVSGGVVVAGYFVCAALAGLMGSVASHQGLRNVELRGFDSFPRSRSYLRTAQLDALKEGGVFVCSTAPDGTNYIRWAVTTDPTELNTREEMIRRNVDMFQLVLLKDVWGQFIGNANATSSLLVALKARLTNLVNRLLRQTNVGHLGAAVLSVTINSLGTNASQADQIDAELTFVGPAPNNQFNLTITL